MLSSFVSFEGGPIEKQLFGKDKNALHTDVVTQHLIVVVDNLSLIHTIHFSLRTFDENTYIRAKYISRRVFGCYRAM